MIGTESRSALDVQRPDYLSQLAKTLACHLHISCGTPIGGTM